MRRLGIILFHGLHQVGFAVWFGGMLVLGAVAAPAMFRAARAAGQTRWGEPLYTLAGTAAGDAFGRFNQVALVAGGVMLLSGLLYGLLAGLDWRGVALRAGLTALAWAAVAWLAFVLFPRMIELRAAGQMESFDRLHEVYGRFYQAQALLLLGAAGVTAWLHARRDAAPGRAPGACPAAPPAPKERSPA